MEVDRIDGGYAKENIESQKVFEKMGMKEIENSRDDSLDYFMTLRDYTDVYYS